MADDGRALSVFGRGRGSYAGRLAPPANWTPPEGTSAFVLGSDVPGVVVRANVGDYAWVAQPADFATSDDEFVRAKVRARPPALALPSGVVWRFGAMVGLGQGANPDARVTYDITVDRELFDVAIPCGYPPATSSAVYFRLELAGAASGSAASITTLAAPTGNAALDAYVTQFPGSVFRLAFGGGYTTSAIGKRAKITGSALHDGTWLALGQIDSGSIAIFIAGGDTTPDANNGAIGWQMLDFDVELPGLYLDEIVVDDNRVSPQVINRIPFDGATDVPAGTTIALEIVSTYNGVYTFGVNNVALEAGATSIYINDQLAFTGTTTNHGVFEPGFNGAASVFTDAEFPSTGHHGLRIVIDPTSDFTSLEVVTVRVETRERTSGADPRVITYSFTVEDLTPPELFSATAPSRTTALVSSDEPLLAVDPAGTNDALNPANWSVQIASTSLDNGLPAVGLEVVGVELVSPSQFRLTFDIEMTPGAFYQIVAGAIADVHGNTFLFDNTATFTGFSCAEPADRSFVLLDALPRINVEEDESRDLEALVKCFQEPTSLLVCDIDAWSDVLDPDVAPEVFVDAMLIDLGNPFTFELALNDKRKLAHVLVPIYRQKGTDIGIINAVRFFLGLEVDTTSLAIDDVWSLGDAELGIDTSLGTDVDQAALYTFFITSSVTLTQDEKDKITAIANYMKPAHTHLGGILDQAVTGTVDHLELGLSELDTEWVLH